MEWKPKNWITNSVQSLSIDWSFALFVLHLSLPLLLDSLFIPFNNNNWATDCVLKISIKDWKRMFDNGNLFYVCVCVCALWSQMDHLVQLNGSFNAWLLFKSDAFHSNTTLSELINYSVWSWSSIIIFVTLTSIVESTMIEHWPNRKLSTDFLFLIFGSTSIGTKGDNRVPLAISLHSIGSTYQSDSFLFGHSQWN